MIPQLGDIVLAKELGYRGENKYIYHACIDCGVERWVVRLESGDPRSLRCRECASKSNAKTRHNPRGEKAHRWVNGTTHESGYVLVLLQPDDTFYPMAKEGGYIKEHRLVMAKSLGRLLVTGEIVHHKNGVRNDNRIDNLELTTFREHALSHNKGYQDGYSKGLYDGHETRIKQLESRVTQLEAENILLKSQKEFTVA